VTGFKPRHQESVVMLSEPEHRRWRSVEKIGHRVGDVCPPEETGSGDARWHGMNENQVFTWREPEFVSQRATS
jgi:hypothetical protein